MTPTTVPDDYAETLRFGSQVNDVQQDQANQAAQVTLLGAHQDNLDQAASIVPHDDTPLPKVTPDTPKEAPATAAAIQAGASPSQLDWAKQQMRDNPSGYVNYCEQFVENATGKTGLYPSAIAAWNGQQDQQRTDFQNMQPNDHVYFAADNSNGGYGHTGIYAGNGQFVSATSSGPRQVDLGDWQKMTGQKLLGYIPQGGGDALPPMAGPPNPDNPALPAPQPASSTPSSSSSGDSGLDLHAALSGGLQWLGKAKDQLAQGAASLGAPSDMDLNPLHIGTNLANAVTDAEGVPRRDMPSVPGVTGAADVAGALTQPLLGPENEAAVAASNAAPLGQAIRDLPEAAAALPAQAASRAGATIGDAFRTIADWADGKTAVKGAVDAASATLPQDMPAMGGASPGAIEQIKNAVTGDRAALPPGMDELNFDVTKYPEDVQGAIQTLQAQNVGFGAERRFIQTNPATIQKAADLVMTPDAMQALVQRPIGQAYNAEEQTALRMATAMSHQLAVSAAAAGDGENAAKAVQMASAYQETASRAAAEAGRSLQAAQIQVNPALDRLKDIAATRPLNDAEMALLKDITPAPPDVRASVINNLAQVAGATAGGQYGATQNPDDDLRTKIVKAALYGAAGASVGHVVAGGPLNEIGARALDTYVSGLLGTGTGIIKSATDGVGVVLGPGVRFADAIFSGHGLPTSAMEGVASAIGTGTGVRGALEAFVKEMNPNYLRSNALELEQPGLHTLASAGQWIASSSSRLVSGLTEASRQLLTAQEMAANRLAASRGVTDLNNVADSVNRTLLMNKPEGLLAKGAYELAGLPGRVLGPQGARVLVPFKLIPSNLIGQVAEYMPGVGLTQLAGNSDKSLVMVHQAMGSLALAGTYALWGSRINGDNPQNGGPRWAVQVPTGDWVAMSHLPPAIQGPARMSALINDLRADPGRSIDHGVVADFGRSLADEHLFPSILQTLESYQAGGQDMQRTITRTAASEVGGVVPWYLRSAAAAERPESAGNPVVMPGPATRTVNFQGHQIKVPMKADVGKTIGNQMNENLPGRNELVPGSGPYLRSGAAALLGSLIPPGGRNVKAAVSAPPFPSPIPVATPTATPSASQPSVKDLAGSRSGVKDLARK